LVLMVLM
jgi:hypothetical protein